MYFHLCVLHFQIQGVAAGLIAGANVFVFGTVYSYFVFFGRDDDGWEMSAF